MTDEVRPPEDTFKQLVEVLRNSVSPTWRPKFDVGVEACHSMLKQPYAQVNIESWDTILDSISEEITDPISRINFDSVASHAKRILLLKVEFENQHSKEEEEDVQSSPGFQKNLCNIVYHLWADKDMPGDHRKTVYCRKRVVTSISEGRTHYDIGWYDGKVYHSRKPDHRSQIINNHIRGIRTIFEHGGESEKESDREAVMRSKLSRIRLPQTFVETIPDGLFDQRLRSFKTSSKRGLQVVVPDPSYDSDQKTETPIHDIQTRNKLGR